MTAGVNVPFEIEMLEPVCMLLPQRVANSKLSRIAEDRRFAEAVYKVGLSDGVMDRLAYLDLPSGRRVAIVDVPGHQRFLKNMLAGVHGMDAVLLVVAADEGVMPQTREHLAIIDLLGIDHGVVILTKSDLVEPAWLEVVADDVTQLVSRTSLRAAPIVSVSSTSGEGLPRLRVTLDGELERTQTRANVGRPRLPIDRSFAISGFGFASMKYGLFSAVRRRSMRA